jgi:hypothetical protein
MIKRKINKIQQEAEEKPRKRQKKVKVDMNSLPDAAIQGKLLAAVGSKVFFERIAAKGKKVVHEGFIRSVDEKGMVEIWDETIEQFYAFSLNQKLPVIKMA